MLTTNGCPLIYSTCDECPCVLCDRKNKKEYLVSDRTFQTFEEQAKWMSKFERKEPDFYTYKLDDTFNLLRGF